MKLTVFYTTSVKCNQNLRCDRTLRETVCHKKKCDRNFAVVGAIAVANVPVA
ncbi:hypothetical protein [Nostoc sp. UHCC 0870]|uniref:hypothetical protein n=1 Tax=Nostoc sp. UHCC 0870 TaxID=2914041 RepID=UPI0030DC9C9E